MSHVADRIELLESEETRVFAWRYESLIRCGLDEIQATVVAASTFDLHRAVDMLLAGCTAEQLACIAS